MGFYVGGIEYDIKDVMKYGAFFSRKQVMERILFEFEPFCVIPSSPFKRRTLDDNANVIADPPDDDVVDKEKVSDNQVVWHGNKEIKRLPLYLYERLKALFVDKSQHFIAYNWREYPHFDFTLIVSDTAVFYLC